MRVKCLIISHPTLEPDEMGLIVLGDVGVDYYLDKRDNREKEKVCRLGVTIYCVRGNHEQRPELVEGIEKVFDDEINNYIYIHPRYPLIKYLIDGYTYQFNDYKVLILGGAYSVDKFRRVMHGSQWFEQEQLSEEEREIIFNSVKGEKFDFVFSHTCPIEWQPTDLFLGYVDQSKVDNSMEVWLQKVKENIDWGIWCFGHYHRDRIERPKVEMFSTDVVLLDDVKQNWDEYDKTGEVPWWINKSPNYYIN